MTLHLEVSFLLTISIQTRVETRKIFLPHEFKQAYGVHADFSLLFLLLNLAPFKFIPP